MDLARRGLDPCHGTAAAHMPAHVPKQRADLSCSVNLVALVENFLDLYGERPILALPFAAAALLLLVVHLPPNVDQCAGLASAQVSRALVDHGILYLSRSSILLFVRL